MLSKHIIIIVVIIISLSFKNLIKKFKKTLCQKMEKSKLSLLISRYDFSPTGQNQY